jgi:hypothetical protein
MRVKMVLAALAALLASVLGQAQEDAWRYEQHPDPLRGTVLHEFVLTGKYVNPPRTQMINNPALVVICSNGAVRSNYFAVGAVINRRVDGGTVWVDGEARVDGKAELFTFDNVSTDGTAAYFGRKDLKKALLGHQVIIGLNEFLGPQVVMQFDVPNPHAAMEGVCGQDRVLKDIFKNRPADARPAVITPKTVSGTKEPDPQRGRSLDWIPLTPELGRRIAAQAKEISANVLATTKSPAAAAVTNSSDTTKELIKTGQAAVCVIFSDPPGAQIYIDGAQLTMTPVAFALRRREDAPRTITIKKQGYRAIERTIVPNGQTAALDLVLEVE